MRTWLLGIALLALLGPVCAQEFTQESSSSGAAVSTSSFTFNPRTTSTSDVDATDFAERAPTIFVPGLAGGTNPCIVSWSVGGSVGATSGVPGFGLSGGRAYTDVECEVRETLRLAAALSPPEQDDRQRLFLKNIACQSKVMAAALEMTAAESGDPSYGCSGELPEGLDLTMRELDDRGAVMVVDAPPAVYQGDRARRDEAAANLAAIMEGVE